jgi:predicted phosphodiesterase
MIAEDSSLRPTAVRVAVASDLHLEHGNEAPDLRSLEGRADILVAAGDISFGADGVNWLATSPIPSIYICGNHEAYKRDIERTRAEIGAACEAHSHVHFLDDARKNFDFGGCRLRVLGGTLWTDYRLYGDEHLVRCMRAAAIGLNDHRLIQFKKRVWLPEDAAEAFDRTREFLTAELAESFDGVTLVATHHAPTPQMVDDRYAGSILNACFASDIESLMSYADGWVYGHTHSSADIVVNGCRVVSNQHGYSWEAQGFKVRVFEFAQRSTVTAT